MELYIEHPVDGVKRVELNNYQRHIMGQEVSIDSVNVGEATEKVFEVELDQMQNMMPVGEGESVFTRSFTFPRQQGITTGLVFKAIELATNGDSVLFLSHYGHNKNEALHKCQIILDNNHVEYEIERSIITLENGSEIVFGSNLCPNRTKISGDPVVIVDLFDFMDELHQDFIVNKLTSFRKMLISTDEIDDYMISNFHYHKEGETL